MAREREKFLASARLQKQLTDNGARAWVEIFRISEDLSALRAEMEARKAKEGR